MTLQSITMNEHPPEERPTRPGDEPRPRRGRLLILLGPLAFLLVEAFVRPGSGGPDDLFSGSPGASAAATRHALAVTAWVAVWWVTEALPIAVTSLLPLVLLPLLGLGTPAEVSREYGNEILFLFLGGLLIAEALETTGLHERIAHRIVGVFGRERRRLVLGYMIATAFLSMWISNTATAVMMLPIALAVLNQRTDRADESPLAPPGTAHDSEPRFAVALLLGIAYAANIGGFGTPIGSPPTVVFQSIYEQKTGEVIGFARWMLFGVPLILALIPLTWWALVRRLAPGEMVELPEARTTGPLTRDQRIVGITFATAAALWLTRTGLGPLPGWGSMLAERGLVVADSTVAIVAAIALFCARGANGDPILSWTKSSPRLPWGVLILMGAGFALSAAFDRSGLTLWIGQGIATVGQFGAPDAALFAALLVTIVAASIFITEFASNTASASILLPIVFGASAALGEDRFPPDLLMVACALACTAGFAMPAGTPPNALVFGTGRVPIQRFVQFGLLIDACALVAIVLLVGGWYALR